MSLRSRRTGEHGGASLEMVILAPVLMFVCMLIVQTGLYWHAASVAEAAAQEGAAAGRRFDGSEGAARSEALKALDSLGPKVLTGRDVDVVRDPAQVEVTVRGDVISLVPGFSWSVEESASGPVERYVPQ